MLDGTPPLAGKACLVTGAGGGIGRAVALRFAAAGGAVTALDLDADAATACAQAIAGTGGRARAQACDVAELAAVEAAVAAALDAFGRLDVVVNAAAALTPAATVVELAPEAWRRTIEVNLTGAFNVCRAALPAMVAAGGGSVVNVASQLGSVGAPGRAAYCASKAALIHFSRVLALDHAKDNVRVNSLSPGPVWTARLAHFHGTREAAERRLRDAIPLARLGEPEEIAEAALYLAGDRARFTTGSDMVVDGGYTAW